MRWPQIRRPWNPAYQETYDAMNERERQNSFKIDLALVALVIAVSVLLGGCSRVDTSQSATDASMASGGTSPSPRDMEDHYYEEARRATQDAGLPVVIDQATGCQYISAYQKGTSPRMSRVENGKQYQIGCYVEDVVMIDPVP